MKWLSFHYWEVRVHIALHMYFPISIQCPHIQVLLSVFCLCSLVIPWLLSPSFQSLTAFSILLDVPVTLTCVFLRHWSGMSCPLHADLVLSKRAAWVEMGGWTSTKAFSSRVHETVSELKPEGFEIRAGPAQSQVSPKSVPSPNSGLSLGELHGFFIPGSTTSQGSEWHCHSY